MGRYTGPCMAHRFCDRPNRHWISHFRHLFRLRLDLSQEFRCLRTLASFRPFPRVLGFTHRTVRGRDDLLFHVRAAPTSNALRLLYRRDPDWHHHHSQRCWTTGGKYRSHFNIVKDQASEIPHHHCCLPADSVYRTICISATPEK